MFYMLWVIKHWTGGGEKVSLDTFDIIFGNNTNCETGIMF